MFCVFRGQSVCLPRKCSTFDIDTWTFLWGLPRAWFFVLRREASSTLFQRHHWIIALSFASIGWMIGKAMLFSLGRRSTPTQSPSSSQRFGRISPVFGIFGTSIAQKYGIFRLYNAKNNSELKVPGWVDRALVWGWLPLYFLFSVAALRRLCSASLLSRKNNSLSGLRRLQQSLCRISYGRRSHWWSPRSQHFLAYEYRVNRFSNAPRLWMLVGTSLLASSFLWMHPLKAYLAYAFSHALEYTVFVWAFQRRRYHAELEHKPLLGRLLKHPFTVLRCFHRFFIGRASILEVLRPLDRCRSERAEVFWVLQPPVGWLTGQSINRWSIFTSTVSCGK